jgi:head-tail adaptor
MRAGQLDRRVTLQRKQSTRSPSGQVVETWESLGTRFAHVEPVSGEERFSAPQYAAREQVEFHVRWSLVTASLTPLDRIVYPAVEGSPEPLPTEAAIYDVMAVHEIGRREGLRIMTARRVDKAQ